MEAKNPKRAINLKLAAAFIAGIVVAGFLPFYEYSNLVEKNGASYPVRTHRITGRAEIFGGEWNVANKGWVAELIENTQPSSTVESTADKTLPPEEISKLAGEFVLTNTGFIEAEIYNGTNHAIRSVVIGLSVINDGDNAPTTRRYKLTPSYPYDQADPLQATSFKVNAGIRVAEKQKIKGKIESATFR